MNKNIRRCWTALAITLLLGSSGLPTLAGAGNRPFALITGTVRDHNGSPVGGAIVALLREGAGEVIRQTTTAADGTFSAKVNPGRYSVRASANGFSPVLFSAVQFRASDELIYRFNLQPVGSGATAPEKRNDRDSAKWRLRSSQGRRSIFQVNEGETQAIEEALAAAEDTKKVDSIVAEVASGPSAGARVHGVVETYAAATQNPLAPVFGGINFALLTPVNSNLDFIFSGQTGLGKGVPERFEAQARVRAGDRHRLTFAAATASLPGVSKLSKELIEPLSQFSVRTIDEWIVRDGIVVVLGLDYSRFMGASNAHAFSPRLGVQFDANGRTRLRMAYAPGGEENAIQSGVAFEEGQITFKQPTTTPVALVDGRAVMEKSRRLEFGVERVLDNRSSVEATAFFDTTSGRGVGLLSMPINSFGNESGETLLGIANQQGAARGLRVVYTHRISYVLTASAGYAFGRGQQLSPDGIGNPADVFGSGFFQTAALQLSADLPSGMGITTVFRFSPRATVFAIDPFAGRLAVYDPSLSIVITQELPTFGLPVRAQAVLDARNLLDLQPFAEDTESLLLVNSLRRSIRGGISVRF